jgi:hypothetical protein
MAPVRVMRYLGLDRNPLRRTTDRVDTWLTLALMATMLLAGPVVAWTAGAAAYRTVIHTGAEGRADRFAVNAILEADSIVYPVGVADGIEASPQRPPVPARWTGPDGSRHNGNIVPRGRDRAGSAVVIWTDAQGNLASSPRPYQDAVGRGVTVGLLAFAGLALVAVCLRLAVRRQLDRRRLASWQAEWTLIEPRWSGRRPR